MTKVILFIIGIAIEILAIIVLRNGNWPTSGLMMLSVGIVILLVAVVLKFRKVRDNKRAKANAS